MNNAAATGPMISLSFGATAQIAPQATKMHQMAASRHAAFMPTDMNQISISER